jgi:hypothetical protein
VFQRLQRDLGDLRALGFQIVKGVLERCDHVVLRAIDQVRNDADCETVDIAVGRRGVVRSRAAVVGRRVVRIRARDHVEQGSGILDRVRQRADLL